MVLDQYAYRTKQQFSSDVFSYNEINRDEVEEIMYWREHPRLQGFMSNLFYKKDGIGVPYIASPLKLTVDDLLELKKQVINKSLPKFSDWYNTSDYYYDDDLLFIEKAIQFINEGYTVYYDCWWEL